MSLGRAMKTTDLNGGLNGGFGTLGPASGGKTEKTTYMNSDRKVVGVAQTCVTGGT